MRKPRRKNKRWEYANYTKVITNVDLKLKNGSTEPLYCYTECLDYPDQYWYLEDVPVTSSTDICLAICAGSDIESLEKEWQKELILPLFLFYKGKMAFDDFLEKLREINQNIDSDDDTIWEIIDQLECIEDNDWKTEEDLIKWSGNIISDILEEPLLNEDAVKEIKIPDVPIPASDIECIEWTSYDYCQIRYIDWCSQEDYDEFRSDSHTEPSTPHFKYLLTKWTVYKNEWAIGTNRSDDPLGCGEECSVEEALYSGDIDKLNSEWWYREDESIFYINHNTPPEPEKHESLKSYEFPAGLKEIKAEYEDQFRLIEKVTIPDSAEIIQSNTFLWSWLKSVYIPDGVKEIGDSAFYKSGFLESVHLPNALQKIGEKAFDECSQNLVLEIPKSVSEIGFTERRDILQYASKHNVKIHIDSDQWECYDIYKLIKKYIDKNDSEMIRLLIDIFDIPDDFMEFWHVGIMHDAISSDSAGITANLLNSGKLRFLDEELEYLIDYAIESGKPEHTACLLNYKNEKK